MNPSAIIPSEDAQTVSRLQRNLTANLFLLLISVYFLTSSGNTVDVTDDGILRFTVTESIVERGSFALTEEVGQRWGLLGPDGRYFANHGLGQSLLAVPFYCVGKLASRPKFVVSFLAQIVSTLVCLLLFHFCRQLGYRLRTACVLCLIAGFCTQLWPESKSPFNHNTEALFSLLSVFLVYRYQQSCLTMMLPLAGASLGFAILTRVTTLLWLLPLAILLFPDLGSGVSGLKQAHRFLRSGLLFLAGLLPFVALCLWYNAYRFGSILESGYSLWAKQHNFENFDNPLWVGLTGELISPGKGVFWYCPILLLVPFAVKAFFQRQPKLALVFILATCIYLPFFARYSAWHGDNAWGPRYLTFLMPCWIMMLGAFLERGAEGRRWGVPLKVLVVLSFLIQLGSVMVDKNLHYNRLFESGVINDANTYSYPLKLYFDPKYSGLVNRPSEVGGAFRFTARRFFEQGNAPASNREELESLDFWWTNRMSRGIQPAALLLLVGPIILYICITARRIKDTLGQF